MKYENMKYKERSMMFTLTNHRRPVAVFAAFLGLMILATPERAKAQEPQVINVPLSRPGEPLNLEMSILSARIEVLGEDREDVQFEVAVAEGTRKIITPSGTRELTAGAYAIEVSEEDNAVELNTDWRANRVRVVARIPSRAEREKERGS